MPVLYLANSITFSLGLLILRWRLLILRTVGRRPRRVPAPLASRRARRRRHQLTNRQFAIAVLVQSFKRGAGIGDFRFINDAIVIGVERRDDRRRRGPMPSRASRTSWTCWSFVWRRALVVWR